VIIVYLTVN